MTVSPAAGAAGANENAAVGGRLATVTVRVACDVRPPASWTSSATAYDPARANDVAAVGPV